ncbi:MAG: serine hydrolase [bacterium]|nr:serine hydrolase [bacterium]
MKQSNVFKLILLLIIFQTFVHCSDSSVDPAEESPQYVYRQPAQLSDGWQTSSMSDESMNSAPMYSLIDNLNSREEHHVNSILIIKNNRLVFEEYFPGYEFEFDNQDFGDQQFTYTYKEFDDNTVHYMASATKSITSALMGVAIDEGFINNVDEKLFSYFPEYSNLNTGNKDDITIEHLLTMTSGIPWFDNVPHYDSRSDEYHIYLDEDPLGFVLGKNLFASPGTAFAYNSGSTLLCGEIVSRASEMDLATFAENYLFTPLGITNYHWENCRGNSDISFAGGGLYMTPRDMAKIGQLYLQDGVWNGDQIVSAGWVNASTTPTVVLEDDPDEELFEGYGYQWWLGSFSAANVDVYVAAGWGGQYIIVLPVQNTVVVITQDDYEWDEKEMLETIIFSIILSL